MFADVWRANSIERRREKINRDLGRHPNLIKTHQDSPRHAQASKKQRTPPPGEISKRTKLMRGNGKNIEDRAGKR
jgi:hypothetical protein